MGAITMDGVLRAEHDLVAEALMTCGNEAHDIRDCYNYIFGVNDLAEKLINTLEGKHGGDGND